MYAATATAPSMSAVRRKLAGVSQVSQRGRAGIMYTRAMVQRRRSPARARANARACRIQGGAAAGRRWKWKVRAQSPRNVSPARISRLNQEWPRLERVRSALRGAPRCSREPAKPTTVSTPTMSSGQWLQGEAAGAPLAGIAVPPSVIAAPSAESLILAASNARTRPTATWVARVKITRGHSWRRFMARAHPNWRMPTWTGGAEGPSSQGPLRVGGATCAPPGWLPVRVGRDDQAGAGVLSGR